VKIDNNPYGASWCQLPAFVQNGKRETVLLTKGDENPPVVVPLHARAAEFLPNTEFMTIPSAGHVPQRLQAPTYVEILQDFIGV
jgi:pimeloyl-ACP methyl ester carboxylesterase